jgi:FKBP-type peptidyl-prolyl cis-trans isomerase 2
MMKKAENGNTVKVHYTGKLDDGTVFDSSRDSDPLEFTVGSGQVIKGFDQAVSGMGEGEQKTVNIPAAEAYGPLRDEMVLTINRDQLPKNLELKEGLHLQLTQPNGSVFNVMVKNLTEESVTLDGNHPLAGRDLNFDIELMEVM